jgi:carbon storage regulator
MLVLTRKKGQSIIVLDNIEISVLEIEGDTIKLGISAPKEVSIMRKELLSSVKESNQESAGQPINAQILSDDFKKLKKKY